MALAWLIRALLHRIERDSKWHPLALKVMGKPQFWYYLGDSLDWLDVHSQLTGVGKVSTELFFVSSQPRILPCVSGKTLSHLRLASAESLDRLASRPQNQKTCDHAVGKADIYNRQIRSPRPGDHVFFTGLVWTPSFTALFKRLASRNIDFSVLVHDIIPIESPELTAEKHLRSFSEWLTTTIQTATIIFVSSKPVGDQIIRWALLSGYEIKARIFSITFGVREIEDAPLTSPSHLRKLDRQSFVLSVGTIDFRKNQIFLCRIWKRLTLLLPANDVPQLVLVGRKDIDICKSEPDLASLFNNDKIVILEGLSDQQVAGLYKTCQFTAFPSLSEGYGIPISESLLYGKLCLSSNLPVIYEHAKDLIWYFSPKHLDEAVELFRRAIERPEERKKAEARIKHEYRAPKWSHAFQSMISAAEITLREPAIRIESETPPAHIPGAQKVDLTRALHNARLWCSSDDPEVSILIINQNAVNLTLECIRQIWAHTEGYQYEIVIADNGSSSKDIVKLRNVCTGIRLLDLGCNRFFGEANNIAAEASRGRFLCMLNNDAFVRPGWLNPLMEPLFAEQEIGATGPLFLSPDGTVQEAGAMLDANGFPIRFGRGDKTISADLSKPKFVDHISAATLLIRREVFMQVGGYDLAYEPLYYEDFDLCLKLRVFGWKVLYCPASRVIHEEGLSSNHNRMAEAHRDALVDLNRDKFIARWGQYLKNRKEEELVALRESLTPHRQTQSTPVVRSTERTAVVYSPYALTPGGGERYLLTLAAQLARHFIVTIVTPHAYSMLRLRSLGQTFSLDLSKLLVATEIQFKDQPNPDLMVTMGNHVIPPVKGRGRVNIFHCQFPFSMDRIPNLDERTVFSGYNKVIVNSKYTASHFNAAITALQLPKPTIQVVYPPVPLLAGDFNKKKRMILSVGRFFVGQHSKRQDILIATFKSICNQFSEPIELHLAGSSTPTDEHMNYLISLKTAANGYPIYFHVNSTTQHLQSLYRDAYIYWHGTGVGVNLSREPEKAEHFGISLVEAMSAQAIPFALNWGGPSEIIKDGDSGFLYDSLKTLERMTLAVLSEADNERSKRIMQAARLRAQDFSIDNFVQNVETLIGELT